MRHRILAVMVYKAAENRHRARCTVDGVSHCAEAPTAPEAILSLVATITARHPELSTTTWEA